jgi:hypothetical protein
MTVTFATGTDARLFWNACALAESFAAQNPGRALRIGDFGLEPRQLAFLEAAGLAVAAPPDLRPAPHPWLCKTALADYPGLGTDWLAWVDADMVAVGPAAEDADRIAETLRAGAGVVAVCADRSGFALGEFVEAYAHAGVDVAPFDAMLAHFGVDRRQPYLNTGFVLVARRAFWSAWRTLTATTRPHLAFDQSSFNALAYASGLPIEILDAASWNVHNDLLERVDLAAPAREPVRFLHPTSQDSEHHEEIALAIEVGDHKATLPFKTFRRADLREVHLAALRAFLARHGRELLHHGLLGAP